MKTTTNHAAAELAATVRAMEAYLARYVTFTDGAAYTFALALWAAATHLWPDFDAFPYLTITSDTKRSGKTRLSEVLSFLSANSKNMAGMTAATLFRSIRDDNPTIFIDEAETLSSESADVMRSVLNVGYRRGQTIPRMGKAGVEEWPAFCPKVFVLIGDVFDTLRDRSIIIRMQRGQAPSRFLYEPAKADGEGLRDQVHEHVSTYKDRIIDAYMTHAGLSFLQDRDEEIWLPLFAVCAVLCPDRVTELTRVAVDMATEKSVTARRHTEIQMQAAEREASDTEYSERLLTDSALVFLTSKHKHMHTHALLDALHALPTGPWRKFRGEGLSAIDMANLLDRYGVKPRLVRGGTGRASKVGRGYRRADIDAAAKQLKH